VRDFLSLCETPGLWLLFFATTVYGHVALKFAVDRAEPGDFRRALVAALVDHWGWSACLAWGVSCVLWAAVLSRQTLLQANAVSSLRFVLICLAACVLLGESLNRTQTLGMALIAAGILLVR
jgi:drug/metabolite transporter (DMT)-like permease